MTPATDAQDRPARVLIVDDERSNRQLLEVMLQPEGHELITATTGEEALAIVAASPPDLILLDVMMPGMDGYQVAFTIKGNFATRNIPIIMITALDDRSGRMLGLSAGAEEFLTKPVDRAELCARVRNLLRLRAYGHYAERLKEVDQLKVEFLSTVSHELRTPLTSIRGSLGLLASGAAGPLSEEVLQIVALAERNALRLITLVNEILDLERLDTGTTKLNFAQVPAAMLIERAIEMVGPAAAGVVVMDIPDGAVDVWCDADKIVQVLVNLLANAIKFSPPGGAVDVTVRLRDNWAEFRVRDRGRGVPAADRRLIFERFRQVEASDAREKGGTGLGLAICKSIVERHGGTLGLEDADGDGSVFWFRVTTSSHLLAPVVDHPVMIVGDRRGTFEPAVRAAGYSVISTLGDDAAMDALERTPVSAVMVQSGSSLVSRLRLLPALERVPVLLFGNPALIPATTLSDDMVFVLPMRTEGGDALATLREGLERGHAARRVHASTSSAT